MLATPQFPIVNYGNFVRVDAAKGYAVGRLNDFNHAYNNVSTALAAVVAAGWTSGAVLVAAGTYNFSSQMVGVNGIDIVGSGQDCTFFTSTNDSSATFQTSFRAASNATWSGITFNCAVNDGNYHTPIGLDSGDALTITHFTLEDCTVIGDTDCIYFNSPSGPSSGIVVRNCYLTSSWDTFYSNDGSSFDYFGCELVAIGPNTVGGDNVGLCHAVNNGGGYLRLYNCRIMAMNGGGQTAGIQVSFQGTYAAFVEVIGGEIITLDPGYSISDWLSGAGTGPASSVGVSTVGTKFYNPPTYASVIPSTYVPASHAPTDCCVRTTADVAFAGLGYVNKRTGTSAYTANTMTVAGKLMDAAPLSFALTNTSTVNVTAGNFTSSTTATNQVDKLVFTGSAGVFTISSAAGLTGPITYSTTDATLLANVNAALLQSCNLQVQASGTHSTMSLTYVGETVNATSLTTSTVSVLSGNITCTPSTAVAGVAPGYNMGLAPTPQVLPGTTIYPQFLFNATTGKFDYQGSGGIATPLIVATAGLTGQTAAVSGVISFTPAVAGTYRLSACVTLTADTTDVLNATLGYSDETSTAAITSTLNAINGAGTGSISIGPTTGKYYIGNTTFRSKAGVAIKLNTVLATGGGSTAYDIYGVLEQLSN